MSKKNVTALVIYSVCLVIISVASTMFIHGDFTSASVKASPAQTSQSPKASDNPVKIDSAALVTKLTTLPGVKVDNTTKTAIVCPTAGASQTAYTLSGLSYDAALAEAKTIVKENKAIKLVQDGGAALLGSKLVNLVFPDTSAILINFSDQGSVTLMAVEECK